MAFIASWKFLKKQAGVRERHYTRLFILIAVTKIHQLRHQG
jgi:hypothetical protein